MADIHEEVKEYYSDVTLNKGGEMRTSICHCSKDQYPKFMREILKELPDDIVERSYGCGSPVPLALEGCTVLDLGCGTGQDTYLASKLVGPEGKVIGVDMNDDQLDVAKRHQEEVAEKWGFSNVEFHKGYIEDLSFIPDESVDVVISNCVLNLVEDKERIYREIWRVLKFGGELYFSDIFSDRRVPEEVNKNPVLYGECLGGVLYVEDFRRLLRKVGWEDFRYVTNCPVSLDNEELEALIGNIQYSSRTVRAMKLPGLQEDICEQYGQFLVYNGGIEGAEFAFDLDDHHHFEVGQGNAVCGNSCAMIQNTRFAKYFTVYGDRSTHYGPFEGCGGDAEDGGCGCGGGCC